jgi:putative spermidine/putrescine transport system permease protein
MKHLQSLLRGLTITIGLLFFGLPIYAAAAFAFKDREGNFSLAPLERAGANQELMQSLALTLQIALGTVVITLLLLIPTIAFLHLALPQARTFVEFLTLTPLVIPPIVQGVGFLYSMPTQLKSTPNALIFAYVILALPFSYRAIDAAFSTIEIRTLFEASISLGASFLTVIRKVIIPNVSAGIFGAVFLTIALVLGEFAYASLLLWDTFPTQLAVAGLSDANTAVALSVLSLVGVWLILNSLTIFSRRSNYTVTGAR